MIKKPTKIVLCGYYGCGNLGDEMILGAILTQIKESHPHADIRILKNKSFISNARKMTGAELFIFGGGSILQNATSNASLFYYLGIIHLSRLLCKRKIMLSNGIGPIIERKIPQKILLRFLARAINHFDFISVRDTDSQKLLKKLLPHRKIHLVPDPALIEFAKINQRLINSPCGTSNDAFFVFCPHANSIKKAKIDPQTIEKSLSELSALYRARLKIVIFNEKEDLTFAKSLAKHLENAEIITPHTQNEAARALSGAKFVISSRYHASLLAISLGLPTLSVSTDPKITALYKDFYAFPASPPSILNDSKLLNSQIGKMMNYYGENKELISSRAEILANRSNAKIKNVL